jgi:threonine dehydrogenase-like Zn-dependent dehydrogenase
VKQILQNLGSGETLLADVPTPSPTSHGILVESRRSLVSLGTEKMLIDFGRGGWIAKARSQPDKVRQVLEKIKTDGLWTTLDAVKAKLDTPIPLGYCNVGVAREVSRNSSFQVGERVASNGPHAELVSVSDHLAARVPDAVSDDQAAFTVVGAIALQGIRLIAPTLGERIVVSGLGLIGLLAVQMLRAGGCQVLGIDYDPVKLELAERFGAATCNLSLGQDPLLVAEQWSRGIGVDGVLITASTKSDQLIHQAATMCRQRGRIVLVGVIGLNLQRADFYEKELSFQVSCSYGPGRYDPDYERRGIDYPIGFVRWTEQRNFEAVLQLMADGRLDLAPLITHRFSIDRALDAYQAIQRPGAMGILLEYGAGSDAPLNGSSSYPTAVVKQPTAFSTFRSATPARVIRSKPERAGKPARNRLCRCGRLLDPHAAAAAP